MKKKSYFAPNTETVNLASEGVMLDPMAINTTSCGTFTDVSAID